MKNNNGLSLIEVMVSVFILTIIASLFVSMFATSVGLSRDNMKVSQFKDNEISAIEQEMASSGDLGVAPVIIEYTYGDPAVTSAPTVKMLCKVVENTPDPSATHNPASPATTTRPLKGLRPESNYN